jgi:hypothetical protein
MSCRDAVSRAVSQAPGKAVGKSECYAIERQDEAIDVLLNMPSCERREPEPPSASTMWRLKLDS